MLLGDAGVIMCTPDGRFAPAPEVVENMAGYRFVITMLLALVLTLVAGGIPAGADERPVLSLGVVPQQAPGELADAWTPIATYLGERTGLTLRFATARDIPTFEQRLAEGVYDFAYMNPYHYMLYHEAPGYRALAREEGAALVGIVVVREDSPYRDITDLAGESIAFPGPHAFAATILPCAEMERLGIPVAPSYVSSHDSVYLAVARDLFAAGGGIVRTFEHMPPAVRDQLRILWRTDAYTPHPIAVHPRVAGPLAERVQAALLTMVGDPRGAALLGGAGLKGLTAARDADYDDIRRLRLPTPAAAR